MGKKEEKKTVSRATVLDENNIENVINGGQTNDITMLETVQNKLKEESDETQKNLILRRYKKAQYRNGQALLENKRSKATIEKVSLYKVRQMTRLIRFLVGAVVDEKTLEYAKTPDDIWKKETLSKDGKSIETTLPDGTKKTFKEGEQMPPVIDVVDFDNMTIELENELKKRRNEVEEEYENNLKKLDLLAGEYWDRSWRW
ncbi:hypothetical protein [Sharpea azabuensis]|uniref:hypothetical protein n=1 Tax=Sharpea azabuensis TaxID=322505 RepID=UPI001568B97E|nr:hypothetical protein [Sharpea azabuensis]